MSGGAGRPVQVSPEAWAQAALDEIETAGVAGLSVQAVARRLGVSKGGAYHHFRDRRALLVAALALWERRFSVELAERFEAVADPRERLRALMRHALAELEPTVVVQLMAAADDPDVAAALRAAAAARLDLLRRTFTAAGCGRAEAGHRATIAYAVYLGLAHLRVQAPDLMAAQARSGAYLRSLEELLPG